VPLSGAIAQQRQVEAIANNVANANTPGFKKDQVVFEEYMTELHNPQGDINVPVGDISPQDFYQTNGAENSKVKIAGTYTDFEQGQHTPTGNPLDISLQGNGFLEILTPNGVRFTRQGILSIAQDGTLITNQGFPVLSAGPTPAESRMIKVPNAKLKIVDNGDVFADQTKVTSLSVVEFNDMHTLKKEGSGLYINENLENQKPNQKTTVKQGFLEDSNVNAVAEMSSLIKANRQFESIQRAIKAYDNISGRAVNDIAKF
jgi:flagellar basal-body rod protein FlgG